jgi:uncharacterized membrane protein YdjX (TVP38/TMEM64 family)
MFIAGIVAVMLGLGNVDAATVLAIGILVALGAAIAKCIHYGVTFYIGKRFEKHKHKKFEANTARVKKWAFMMIFLAAATPIPDEPITVTLGLMKYSITKFFTAFFLGKVAIAVMGAFLGKTINDTVSTWFNLNQNEMYILMTIMTLMLTIIIIIIMVKVDLGKFTRMLRRKKPTQNELVDIAGKIN